MRPGQLTPENQVFFVPLAAPVLGFNEAGTINPGKPDMKGEQDEDSLASMRPGQLTPENWQARPQGFCSLQNFNEAGAINPGKRGGRSPGARR